MKILFMANVLSNPNSGAAGTEYQTIEALRQLGHTVDEVWENDLSHHISHYNLYYLLELPIAYRTAMLNRFRHSHYDVVHVNQPHGYLAAKTLSSIDSRAICVHRSHGFEPRVQEVLKHWKRSYGADKRPVWRRTLSVPLENCLEINYRLAARYAYGHIVSNTECHDFLRYRYGVSEDRIANIPQAPNVSFQSEMLPMTEQRMKKLLYVGQYAFVKAPMIVAQATEKILSMLPEVSMTWVCDSRHHAEARALFKDARLMDRISFIGWQEQTELKSIYDAHGVFLFPSFFEGFGKAFIEAMSRGLVVIAASNGGMKDVIVHEKSGLLVPTGDVERTVSEVIRVIASPSLFFKISRSARDQSRQYTWRRVALSTVNCYETLLKKRNEKKIVAAA